MKRILIVSGGTGGHIYPGIALAEELKNQEKEVIFITKEKNKVIIESYGFPVFTIIGQGWERKISGRFFNFFKTLFIGFFQSAGILLKLKPEIIIGMGGYLSFPPLILGWIFRKKTLIYESNFFPGLANRLLAFFTSKIAVAFEATGKYFSSPQKLVVVGFPVRKEINPDFPRLEALKKLGLEENKFTLLIFGGSQGAHYLNRLILDVLPLLNGLKNKIQFIHLSGEKDFPEVSSGYQAADFPAKVFPYFSQMELAYAASDLVISRSGAGTIAELIAVRKPAILIPFRYATEQHQQLNAAYLSGYGAAKIFSEKELSRDFFSKELIALISFPEKLRQMSNAYQKISFPTSAQPLAELIATISNPTVF